MRRVEPIRRTVQAALILALLAVAVGGKKKGEPPQQKIEPCSPVAPIASIDPPSLPQDAVTIEIRREQQNRRIRALYRRPRQSPHMELHVRKRAVRIGPSPVR
jgi:hypothetical protein